MKCIFRHVMGMMIGLGSCVSTFASPMVFIGQGTSRLTISRMADGGPNMTDIGTVRSLGWMAWNAYYERDSRSHYPVDRFNETDEYGWTSDGIRGHLYRSQMDDLVVISVKGTSAGAFGLGGRTSERDKLNDNYMFSCCCTWTGCGCMNENACTETCVRDKIQNWADSYYRMGVDLVNNVRKLHEKSQIWIVGHSLGGALAGVLGQAFGYFAVGFEAPGDAMFSHRLGFVSRPGTSEYNEQMLQSKVYHVGNSGDPIFRGQCGSLLCYLAGYSVETKCHLGRECVFDTGSISINKHRIGYMLFDVLMKWDKPVPVCEGSPGCTDCSV